MNVQELAKLIKDNSYNLVAGSLEIIDDVVTFQVTEIGTHDVRARVLDDGTIEDSEDDGDVIKVFTGAETYAKFLRGEELDEV